MTLVNCDIHEGDNKELEQVANLVLFSSFVVRRVPTDSDGASIAADLVRVPAAITVTNLGRGWVRLERLTLLISLS